jgi:Ca-activated chloride channel family protein
MSGFAWGEPRWFWALLLLPILLLLFVRAGRWRRRALLAFVGARLAPRLTAGVSPLRRRARFGILLLALALLVTVLARPQAGFTQINNDATSGDIVFLMDTSRSMLATDVFPNRLERCKLAARDLLHHIGGNDFVGVIAVAGTSFVQAPLTNDYSAVEQVITSLDTSVLPVGGTDFTLGLRECQRLLELRPGAVKAIVFFTDGEDLEGNAAPAAKELAERGIVIHAVAFGTPEGSLIPIPTPSGGTDFVYDPDGNIVRTHLDLPKLRALTSAGSGILVQPANEAGAIDRLWRDGLSNVSKTRREGCLGRIPNEYYQWPLAAVIALLVLYSLINERSRHAPAPASLRPTPSA